MWFGLLQKKLAPQLELTMPYWRVRIKGMRSVKVSPIGALRVILEDLHAPADSLVGLGLPPAKVSIYIGKKGLACVIKLNKERAEKQILVFLSQSQCAHIMLLEFNSSASFFQLFSYLLGEIIFWFTFFTASVCVFFFPLQLKNVDSLTLTMHKHNSAYNNVMTIMRNFSIDATETATPSRWSVNWASGKEFMIVQVRKRSSSSHRFQDTRCSLGTCDDKGMESIFVCFLLWSTMQTCPLWPLTSHSRNCARFHPSLLLLLYGIFFLFYTSINPSASLVRQSLGPVSLQNSNEKCQKRCNSRHASLLERSLLIPEHQQVGVTTPTCLKANE